MASFWRSLFRKSTLLPCFVRKQSFAYSRLVEEPRGFLTGGGLLLPWSLSLRWVHNINLDADETSLRLKSSQSPWLLLPPEFDGGDNKSCHCFYSLAEKRVIRLNKRSKKTKNHLQEEEEEEEGSPDDDARCVGSSHGWLALINPRDCALYLSNPITLQNIRLPSIETLPCIWFGLGGDFESRTPQDWSSFIFKMLIMSSPPTHDDCIVMAIGGYAQVLAFCRPGDTTWTALDGRCFYEYEHIAYSSRDKLFYAVSIDSKFEAWDLHGHSSGPKRREIVLTGKEWGGFPARSEGETYLKEKHYNSCNYIAVEPSSGELLCIRRFFCWLEECGWLPINKRKLWMRHIKTQTFDVFKLGFGEKTAVAEYQNHLDAHAFFIGLNHSLCLSACEFPELTPNSIYFTDDHFSRDRPSPHRGQDMGVYNFDYNSFTPPFCPFDLKNIRSPMVWFTPTPPPTPPPTA